MARNSKASAETNAQGVDLPEVERLLDFMQKHGLEEFEYERNGFRIRLRKPSMVAAAAPRFAQAPETTAVASPPLPGHDLQEHASASPAGPSAGSAQAEELHVIKSPIVGTYYAAPNPGAENFVSVGSRVEAGQVLCIIEAMKLMNEIESDLAGEVVRIFVENGHPVEYGQSLFGIRPHRVK
jgi:acetyl-CoA carboxylase biotin carboxyl carrier protein